MRVRRFSQNPIIGPDMLAGADGDNINGPSLILAPDWLPGRLGRFYLYFAHHRGTYIRLAYADALEGPWSIYRPGSLQLEDAVGCRDHIASPDVHVDHARKEIGMYCHCMTRGGGGQLTYFARSTDGIHFRADAAPIANFYLRAVPWRDRWIAMAKGGIMYASKTGISEFRQFRRAAFPISNAMANEPGDVRHVALNLEGDNLQIYFTRIGDAPERILRADMDLSGPAGEWQAKDVQLVLAPETAWEGTSEPLRASRSGAASRREHAVRDPAIFTHAQRTYLLYSVAGESGIAIAELNPSD